jgi:hypothetical protein
MTSIPKKSYEEWKNIISSRRSALPRHQFERFAAGEYHSVYNISSTYPEATKIDIMPLMSELRRLVRIIGKDEARRLIGYDDSDTSSTNNNNNQS